MIITRRSTPRSPIVAARLGLTLSFVALVLFLPMPAAVVAAAIGGTLPLVIPTWAIAQARKRPVIPEIVKHLVTPAGVMVASKAIGGFIVAWAP